MVIMIEFRRQVIGRQRQGGKEKRDRKGRGGAEPILYQKLPKKCCYWQTFG